MLCFYTLGLLPLPTQRWEAGCDLREEWDRAVRGTRGFTSPPKAATAVGGFGKGKTRREYKVHLCLLTSFISSVNNALSQRFPKGDLEGITRSLHGLKYERKQLVPDIYCCTSAGELWLKHGTNTHFSELFPSSLIFIFN